MKFGEFVKMNRKLKNMSKQELIQGGAHLGGSCEAVSIKRLSEIENGSKKANINQAKELAKVLKFDIDKVKDIFDIKDNVEWIDTKEAEKIHNYSRGWIYPHLKNGDIKGKKEKYTYWKDGEEKESFKWMIDKKSLKEYISNDKEEWITIDQASILADCSGTTIYDRYKKGKIKRKKINGAIYYSKKDVKQIKVDRVNQSNRSIKSGGQIKEIKKINKKEFVDKLNKLKDDKLTTYEMAAKIGIPQSSWAKYLNKNYQRWPSKINFEKICNYFGVDKEYFTKDKSNQKTEIEKLNNKYEYLENYLTNQSVRIAKLKDDQSKLKGKIEELKQMNTSLRSEIRKIKKERNKSFFKRIFS